MNAKERERILATLDKCESITDVGAHFDSLLKIREDFNSDAEKRRLQDLLTAIGNEDRLLLLDALKEKDRCVCELEVIVGKSQPAVSHHLKILERNNLIRGWKKGKFTHYSLVKKTIEEFNHIWENWTKKISNWLS